VSKPKITESSLKTKMPPSKNMKVGRGNDHRTFTSTPVSLGTRKVQGAKGGSK
jgi:hypothetical protein